MFLQLFLYVSFCAVKTAPWNPGLAPENMLQSSLLVDSTGTERANEYYRECATVGSDR